jgi:short-subunit dehydrogenase
VLVNNAGFGGYRPFVELEPSVADDLIAIHIRAVTRLSRVALPGMLRRGSGTIINGREADGPPSDARRLPKGALREHP